MYYRRPKVMSNISFWANYEETVSLCTKLKCKDEDIPKVLKASLMDKTSSKHFRELGTKTIESKPFDINVWLSTHSLSQLVDMKSKADSKPVFTPNTD